MLNLKRILFSVAVITSLLSPVVRADDSDSTFLWMDCLSESKKNNPDLISAQEDINQQKAQKTMTASGLYPQISANLNVGKSKSGSAAGSVNSYSYGVEGSQLIYDGFKTIYNVNSASEKINSAKQSYSFVSSEIRFKLRSAFVGLLRAQELINVTEEIVRIRKDNFDLINLRYKSGLEHKGALLTAEANLASAEYEFSKAKRDIEVSQRELSKEMGRKKFIPFNVQGELEFKNLESEKPDFELFAEKHPSLLQILAQKNAAASDLKAAYSAFMPNLSASAGAGKSDSHWPARNKEWNLGLGLSVPIFEGGLRFGEVNKAKALYNKAVADEESTRETVMVNLQKTWAQLQDAMETVGVQRKLLIAAQERQRIAAVQYSTGFITFDNWIIIEDDLVKFKKTYLNAEADALVAEANWIYAKGETLEYV